MINFKNELYRNIKKEVLIFSVFLVICLVLGINYYFYKQRQTVAVKAIYNLYNFENLEKLGLQDKQLKTLTTKEVYKKLTVTNKDRALNTYLKFKGDNTEVKILKNTDNYVLYTLTSDALSEGRKFLFFYRTNYIGKLIDVREMEGIDFYGEIKN